MSKKQRGRAVVARQAHNLEVAGSTPAFASKLSSRIHMMTPALTTLCRTFSMYGYPRMTKFSSEVTCPKCLELMCKQGTRA